ncbi:MAG: prepilin-type N-terminal cleavage/methylation domain-containing protein [Campylobacterota bacterium]|nr:prepilin-type N-terminal cleavage/methylation domain-containing protein [Campylobacterota bacterium]
MKQYKSFTLVEILISISLFSIIVLFLYQSLNITQKSNQFYTEKLNDKQEINNIKKILFLDLIHSIDSKFTIELDNDNNNIFKLNSTNYYHNPFYNNITYLITKEQNLVRIESDKKFDKNKLNDDFFENSYIDILDSNITKFKISKNSIETLDDKIAIYIEKNNEEKIIFGF